SPTAKQESSNEGRSIGAFKNKSPSFIVECKPHVIYQTGLDCSAYGVIITLAHFSAGEPLTALPPVGGKGTGAFNSGPINIVQHTKRVNGFWLYWRKSY